MSRAYAGRQDEPIGGDLRQQIAAEIQQRGPALVGDTVGIFPFSGDDPLDAEYCKRLGGILMQVLLVAIRAGTIDSRSPGVGELHQVALERNISSGRLFSFVYLLERSTLDELAVNETIGATTEPWPTVAQIVRRGSFDLVAAYTERIQIAAGRASLVDALTTLHTRPLIDAVLTKELERAGRFGVPISIMLFDVDRLAAINEQHGYGVGDRILERLGILMRQYFRHHDWVARYAEDAIVVLLTGTDGEHAAELAERVRSTVEQRFELRDHRTEVPVRVTIAAALLTVDVAAGEVVDAERLLADVEGALARAKRSGGNRVVRVDGYSGRSPAGPPRP